VRRESGRGFHKASDFVKALFCISPSLVRREVLWHNPVILGEDGNE
jgi:hypothetical protein